MKKIRMISVIVGILLTSMVYSNADDFLWEKSAKPVDIDAGRKVMVVCTQDAGCQTIYVENQNENTKIVKII